MVDEHIRQEIEGALRRNEGNLGRVFVLMEQGIQTNADLVTGGAVANSGAAGNARASIRAMLDGVIPSGPTVAGLAGRAVGGLLRANPDMSADAKSYLADLRAQLDAKQADPIATDLENEELRLESQVLERELEKSEGVYVFTLMSFYRSPVKLDPERYWFKVGQSDRAAGLRVGEIMRVTGLPEDPWIARVYRHADLRPRDLERKFHRLLESAGHGRADSKHSGKEWFATNLDYLDTIAESLECEILQRMHTNQ